MQQIQNEGRTSTKRMNDCFRSTKLCTPCLEIMIRGNATSLKKMIHYFYLPKENIYKFQTENQIQVPQI